MRLWWVAASAAWPPRRGCMVPAGMSLCSSGRWRWGSPGLTSAGGRWLVRMETSWIEERYGLPVLVPPRAGCTRG
jgi:hypothetical protein